MSGAPVFSVRLDELLARAREGRRCLKLRVHTYADNQTQRWMIEFPGRNHYGDGFNPTDALETALVDSSADAVPKHSCDAAVLAELLEKVGEGKPQDFWFQADFRKPSGNVFRAEARLLTGKKASKNGNDAAAVVGEVLGKLGLL